MQDEDVKEKSGIDLISEKLGGKKIDEFDEGDK
jgi:hypothetical protein